MKSIHFFYRHPRSIYFSIEKIFTTIAVDINDTGKYLVKNITVPFAGGVMAIWKNILFVRRNQAPINHVTGDAHYAILGCARRSINILTIHDCVLLRQTKRTNPRFWLIKWLWYDLPVKKASLITTISEHSKQELIYFTGCRQEKVLVIGNFVDPLIAFSGFIFNEHKPIILFIGTAENKNLDRLLEALHELPVFLDIVGELSSAQVETMQKLNIDFQQSSSLTAEEMRKKYTNCDMLAFPSTYEGFGLPLLEAQATGRPVLTSNISPMKEVAGSGALLIDPFSAKAIRNGILKIIDDDGLREQLIKAGIENVKRFKLKNITDQYIDLYKKAEQRQFG